MLLKNTIPQQIRSNGYHIDEVEGCANIKGRKERCFGNYSESDDLINEPTTGKRFRPLFLSLLSVSFTISLDLKISVGRSSECQTLCASTLMGLDADTARVHLLGRFSSGGGNLFGGRSF